MTTRQVDVKHIEKLPSVNHGAALNSQNVWCSSSSAVCGMVSWSFMTMERHPFRRR